MTPDTEVALLLTARLGQRDEDGTKPLTTVQFSALSRWLEERSLRLRDLSHEAARNQLGDFNYKGLSAIDLERLLDRGTALGVLIERWTSHGLWIVGRTDPEYPQRYTSYLQRHAPPVLFGVGEVTLLQNGGLAVVGSRSANDPELEFAARLGASSAAHDVTIISGAAKGIDSRAMESAIAANGCAVGVLAEGLGRAAVAHEYRDALLDGRLTLISPYEPESRWFPYTAMDRNKLIYGLAHAAVVVSSGEESGGTWTGAVEALKMKQIPVFVRDGHEVPEGNRRLLQSGARPFPESAWEELKALFANAPTPAPLFEAGSRNEEATKDEVIQQPTEVSAQPEVPPESNNTDPYNFVAQIIPRLLREPKDDREFAEALNVVPAQARVWLKRALKEKLIRRLAKPVRYVATPRPDSLFKS